MSCNGCGRPVDSPRPPNCPEPHCARPATADGEQFNAFAELVKWRRWVVQLLGSDGFQGDRDLRTRIAEGADADHLAELRLALRDVPAGGALSYAPEWIVRLHRAACEVAGIGVREGEAKFAAGVVLSEDEGRAVDAASACNGRCPGCGPLLCLRGDAVAQAQRRDEAIRAVSGRCLKAGCPGILEPDLMRQARRCSACDFLWSAEFVAKCAAAAPMPAAAPQIIANAWPPGVGEVVRTQAVDGEPPETPHPHDATCSGCGTRLMFSARRRGDGLCGLCHRHGPSKGTPTLADRCRAAGIEPSLVLEILRSPEAQEALGLTPDARVGRLCRPGEWNGGVARVVGVEQNGRYLLVRDENWSAACEDARVRASDVRWVDETPDPPAIVEHTPAICPRCSNTGIESVPDDGFNGGTGRRTCGCDAGRKRSGL